MLDPVHADTTLRRFYDVTSIEPVNAWIGQVVRRWTSKVSLSIAFRSNDVIDVLADLFIEHGPPEHIRSDTGPEFATAVREWLRRLGVRTPYIEPGSLWENGYVERFNARWRNGLLDGEIFYSFGGPRRHWLVARSLRPAAAPQQPRISTTGPETIRMPA
ncbi:hypothetical protein ASE00_09655 [Sphingomonas sp. Root710]|nr:integrase core domain-containing protein [Sphingomonas sp. Root710]KRB82333.1 hypothetical protein ASE00_09655 [Sphingomonas sp. Root710]